MIKTEELKFNADGLIPVIAQDALTGEVLMQAFMNKQSLELTLKEKLMWYYSRSRQALWNKGATSGHYQHVVGAYADCDNDSLLFKVLQDGAACHTGSRSCFFNKLTENNFANYEILFTMIKTIKDRKLNPKEGSYTTYLFEKGTDKICKKIGEEASETIIAVKNKDKEEIKNEISDLIYHLLVLLENEGVELNEVFEVLSAREGKPSDPKYNKNSEQKQKQPKPEHNKKSDGGKK
ncbi:MAG: bifunctional phosphoribosyl-AMP cyclohydrolase/phosphoribosyl-ATP diphosphatase HisIE [Clostridiales bacterium]|jgi:phosphoribosyl-ATP pyrophosphohydrolase/phosphoribosyl-AMP cyclohydrolase|nr:bifunctional phosphoribosyl-AMP cyclohydrolase/phosphoribosyl-ATP diphosphatase HisIE [Clostridiales bacterium]